MTLYSYLIRETYLEILSPKSGLFCSYSGYLSAGVSGPTTTPYTTLRLVATTM